MDFEELKSKVERAKHHREILNKELNLVRQEIAKLKKEIEASMMITGIIQGVAKKTQQQVEFQISSLVSLSLKSVFQRPYEFKIEFVERRGKTECDLFFEKNGIKFEADEVGGGVLDVAAFALRISLWAIQRPRSREIFILDEPFKNINDPKRILHQKVAEMVKMISQMVKVQIIMISTIPEMEEIADNIFIVSNMKGKSQVRKET